jgi:hypothetical protein
MQVPTVILARPATPHFGLSTSPPRLSSVLSTFDPAKDLIPIEDEPACGLELEVGSPIGIGRCLTVQGEQPISAATRRMSIAGPSSAALYAVEPLAAPSPELGPASLRVGVPAGNPAEGR